MSEYVFRYANGYGCDMGALMDGGRETVGEYFASESADHYGTLHEEIVRCRDCDFSHEDELGNLRCHGPLTEPWDYYYDEPSDGVKVEPDGFCAWAVKRKECGE